MENDKLKTLSKLRQTAFNCARLAYQRKDFVAMKKAIALHKKYIHQYKQVQSRNNHAT